MNRITEVVKNLIILNVIIFLGVSITQGNTNVNVAQYFQLYAPFSDKFQPVQLITHMFMHGSISHLFFNMLALFFLGPYVEQKMGAQRFLIFYLLCGVGALLAHIGVHYFSYFEVADLIAKLTESQLDQLMNVDRTRGQEVLLRELNEVFSSFQNQNVSISGAEVGEIFYTLNDSYNIPVVGASGAIMGVTIAFALFFPNMKLMLLFPPIPIKAKYMAIIIIAIDLFSGVSRVSSGIAHFAHLGGALTGLILVYIWYSHLFKK